MSLTQFNKRCIHFIDDRINPIVLKEMRQAVRSRFLAAIFLLTTGCLLIAMGVFVVSVADPGVMKSDKVLELGKNAFTTVLVIFLAISIFFVPSYSGLRMQRERSKADIDLFFVTALSPMAVMRGKLLSGMLTAGLITCACLPFMTFTYFLRGVDLPSIFIILCTAYILIVTMTHFTLFIATISRHRVMRAISILVLAIMMFSCFSYALYFMFAMLDSGIGSRLGDARFWQKTAFFMIPVLLLNSLFYIAAVTAISPASSNRALPLRIFFTCVILFGGLLVFINNRYSFNLFSFEAWHSICLLIVCGGITAAVCERDEINLRVTHAIPVSRMKRALAFFFYSGSAGGIAWVMLVLIPCYVLLSGMLAYDRQQMFGKFPVIFPYVYAYALSGLLLRRKIFNKQMHPIFTLILIAALLAVIHLLPIIILFLLSGNFAYQMDHTTLYGNIFQYIETKDLMHFYFALLWALAAGAANADWFWKQIKTFKATDARNVS